MKKILIIWALLISVCFAQSKAGFYVVGGKVITVQDTSSRKYLKAIEDAGVVPSVVQNFASNYLITTEKELGVYSGIVAQYPFIGGTSATHKYNANSPLDTDGANRLVFTSVTHTVDGLVFAGAGSANTFFNPSVSLSTSATIAHYTKAYTSGNENGIIYNSGTVQRFLSSSTSATNFSSQFKANAYSGTTTNAIGFKMSIYSVSGIRGFYNGAKVSDNATVAGSFPNETIRIGARRDSSGGVYSFTNYLTGEINYFMLSNSSFTDNQAIQQSKIVTFTQSLLGRQ